MEGKCKDTERNSKAERSRKIGKMMRERHNEGKEEGEEKKKWNLTE